MGKCEIGKREIENPMKYASHFTSQEWESA